MKLTNPKSCFWSIVLKFNAQGSRIIIIVVQVGAMKKYATTVEAWRRSRKMKDKMKFSLPQKLIVF